MLSASLPRQGRTWSVEVAAVAGFGLLLALTGPFGTFGLAPLWERLGYWLAVTLFAYGVCRLAHAGVERVRRRPGPLGTSNRLVILLIASALLTLPVWLASYRHTPRLWPQLRDLVELFPSVLVVSAAILALLWFVEHFVGRTTPSEPATITPAAGPVRMGTAEPRVPFLDRLPPHLGRELIALEMEDHYVRVHTARGSDLILMRMRDAVGEVAAIEGAQVHRSWWVARQSVRGMAGTGRARRLDLVNGLVVPVARDRRDALAHLAPLRRDLERDEQG